MFIYLSPSPHFPEENHLMIDKKYCCSCCCCTEFGGEPLVPTRGALAEKDVALKGISGLRPSPLGMSLPAAVTT